MTKEFPYNDYPSTYFTHHGLPCSISMSPVGCWNGYVGVPKGHALYGKRHGTVIKVPDHILNRTVQPGKDVGYLSMLTIDTDLLAQGRLPVECALAVHGGITFSNDCAPGRDKDGHWYFGFDTSHCDDVAHPDYIKYLTDLTGRDYGWKYMDGAMHRDVDYVSTECRRLAEQLVEWGNFV